jgi:very-short-patch-repair endonuclease
VRIQTESPIEAALIDALLAEVDQYEIHTLDAPGDLVNAITPRLHLSIFPQDRVGAHRVDFLIRCSTFTAPIRSAAVAVECDGHDFHERTREQAARDKRRDRALQAAGFHVARFTGSEIHRDARDVARQVLTFCEEVAR